MNKEVKVYCKTCDTCQRERKNKGGKSPMGMSKIIGQPFVKIAIDIVGPLNITKSRNRYILTIVDLCTRWPEAIPLKTVTTEEVQNALLTVFYRMGFPETILSDNGSQFTSDIFKKVSTLLGIKICHSSVYHAMSNGCVERFNGTLKEMLRKVTFDRPLDWDTYLQAILFAYREVPHTTTGYSPFELMYGRKVRGPMSIVKSIWTEETTDSLVQSSYDYLLELKKKLQTACLFTKKMAEEGMIKSKLYYDRNATNKTIEVGDQVLVLIPQQLNKLEFR